MSNIAFTIGFTGTPDSGDAEAAKHAVARANASRETPLPVAPPAALKASYIIVLTEAIEVVHANNQVDAANNRIEQDSVRDRWKISTDAQRDAAIAQLAPLP